MAKINKAHKYIARDALGKLTESGIRLVAAKPRKDTLLKYDKTLRVYEGYDLCENLLLVRYLMMKRYDMPFRLLEVLLHLGPKNYFTAYDYGEIPKPFSYSLIERLIKTGYIVIAVKGKNKYQHVYTLSVSARHIVTTFYRLLCGEEKMPTDRRRNPLSVSDTAFDKKKMALINKMNTIDPSDSKKQYWQGK